MILLFDYTYFGQGPHHFDVTCSPKYASITVAMKLVSKKFKG